MLVDWNIRTIDEVVNITIDGERFSSTKSSIEKEEYIKDESLIINNDGNKKGIYIGMYIYDKKLPTSYISF